MIADIFIKSYPGDFPWLGFCLRSLLKYARGFRQTIVVIPPGHGLNLTQESVIEIEEQQPGYLFQQVCKLNADRHSSAEYIWHIDSDCILKRPVTPDEFMVNGKPRWLITQWNDCLESKRNWFHVMAKCVQETPKHEFMRRHGLLIPRFAYGAFRDFIQQTHKLTMEAYVMNQPAHEFSEFNCIGFYLHQFHHEAIHWQDTREGLPDNPIEQAWSWGGMTEAERERLTELTA